MGRNERQLGDKLLPKIISAVTQSIVSTKGQLTGHDVKVRAMAGQMLIDNIGHEIAEHWGPHAQRLLDADDGTLTPETRKLIEDSLTGDDQLKAITGLIMGPVSSAIGLILTNELAPLVYTVVGGNPNLELDPQTAANAAAARVISNSDALYQMHHQGYNAEKGSNLIQLALQFPPMADALELRRRGLIGDDELQLVAERNGVPNNFIQPLIDLRWILLTPSDAALAVLRGDISLEQGYQIALANGVGNNNFDILRANTGEPPGAQELQEALRRGFIGEERFTKGILESRIRNEWIPTLLDLRYSPIPTADAVNAHVEGYITEDQLKAFADQNGLIPGQYKILMEAAGDPLSYTDMMRLWRYGFATEDDVKAALRRGRLKDNYIDFAVQLKDSPMTVADAVESSVQGYLTYDQAKHIAEMNGLREQDFDPLWHTAGDPLSKTEMIELWQRGLVTQDQVEAALKQSRLKDSYIPLALHLKLRLPALFETRTLLAEGGLTAEQGTQILLEQGYAANVVKSIVNNAINGKTAVHKTLTEAMYADLYKERAITAEEFSSELKALGYNEAEIRLIQAIYDNQLALSQRNAVISKTRSLYLGHKINEARAQSDLNAIGLSSDMVEKLIHDWNLVIQAEVKLLTAAQVTDAWFMDLFSDNPVDNLQYALEYLTGKLGYSGSDAVTVLEIKNKGPLTSGTSSKQIQGAQPKPSPASPNG
jgi:hypothetical protein